MKQLLLFLAVYLTTAGSGLAQANKNYYLIFSARSPALKPFSIGGHAFVSWGIDGKDSVVYAPETYGFYPKEGTNIFTAILTNQPGRIESGFKKNSAGRPLKQMIIRVDYETWKKSKEDAKNWQGSDYNLFKKNCTAFFEFLACKAQMKIPCSTNIFDTPRNPVNYIKRLWRKNKKRAVRPYVVRFDAEGVRPNSSILGPN